MVQEKLAAKFLREPQFEGILRDAPYKLFGAYSGWLREQAEKAGSGEELEMLQREADRLSDIYVMAAGDLLRL